MYENYNSDLGCKMSPKLKSTENVLIDFSSVQNPDSLQSGKKCYFLNFDKSQTAGNVSKYLMKFLLNLF